MSKKLTYITLALLALILPLTACDNSGTNKGTYHTHHDDEDEQDDEQYDAYCRQHPKDCQ